MNDYELARERRIASNKARLKNIGVCDLASQFAERHLAKPGQLKARAPRVKGSAPTRKSERSSKIVHSTLSEVALSGETRAEFVRYRLSRNRFETESMPKRKAQHEFDEAYVFTNNATQSAAGDWYRIIKCQPELNAIDWDSTCEQIAFTLGQQGLTKDSLAGESEDTAKFVYDTALCDIEDPTVGTQIALRRVMKHLRSGRRTLLRRAQCLHSCIINAKRFSFVLYHEQVRPQSPCLGLTGAMVLARATPIQPSWPSCSR